MVLDTGTHQWMLRALEKHALLGTPAGVTLLLWRKKRVEARARYRASWANMWGYLLWVVAVILTSILSHIPVLLSHIPVLQRVVFSWFPATLAVFCPLFFAVGYFILCLSCVKAQLEEQPFIVLPNLLMLIYGSRL
jgi:hypothetical protein